MAKGEEVEWRRVRRLNGEGYRKVIYFSNTFYYFIIYKPILFK